MKKNGERDVQHKVRVLQHAERAGQVAKTCPQFWHCRGDVTTAEGIVESIRCPDQSLPCQKCYLQSLTIFGERRGIDDFI